MSSPPYALAGHHIAQAMWSGKPSRWLKRPCRGTLLHQSGCKRNGRCLLELPLLPRIGARYCEHHMRKQLVIVVIGMRFFCS